MYRSSRFLPQPTCRGRVALCCALVVAFSGAARAQFVSDDFHACTLAPVWTFVDPSGGGAAAIVGAFTAEARLALSVPGGEAHEIWGGAIGAPHVLQPLTDTDFTAQVKFLAAPAVANAQEGLVVRQDDSTWLRLEFFRDDANELRAAMVGGPTNVLFDVPLPAAPSAPLFMRVTRAGDTWTMAWSPDGAAWQALGAPSLYAFHPDGIGIYAGNRGLAPVAHTVQVDWFGNAPGADEDAARNTLEIAVAGGGQVSRSPDRADYACGESVLVTALDQPGWVFSGWSDGLTGVANPVTVTMDGPRSFTANFAPATVCTLTTSVRGGGAVQLSPPGGVYNQGTVVTVSAVDGTGWTFNYWAGDLVGATNPATLVMDTDHAVRAAFKVVTVRTVTTAVVPAGAGAVVLDPPGGIYNQNAMVSVTAVPAPGWAFAEWSDDLDGTLNPATLVVDADRGVTAHFAPVPNRVLTTTWSAGGHVDRAPDLPDYPYGTRVTLTAVADPGYAFSGWSGDLAGAASPDTVVMDADRNVHATFAVPSQVSDDFNRCELDAPWVVADPLGDGGGASLTGGYTGNAQVALDVKGSVTHEIWNGFIGATHIVRPAADADFTLEVKFDSDLPTNFGQEGLLVKESQASWVRAEFLRDDAGLLRAAVSVGPATVAHDVYLPAGLAPPLWMRVTRVGSVFTQYWSADGQIWIRAGVPLVYAMHVAGVGIYAGNRGSAPPAHTVLADYFSTVAGAPALEDAGLAALATDVTGGGAITRQLDLPSYACGQVEWLTAVPAPNWAFAGWEGGATGTDNPLAVTMNGPRAVTAQFASLAGAGGEVPITRLYPCAPNPFNPRTVVAFDLAASGPVRVTVYAVDGRLVRVLADDRRAAGRYELVWDGCDDQGRRQGSGVYFLRLATADGDRSARMVMLK
jgi:uncharacterized repeat protein (TIGR02543 family)